MSMDELTSLYLPVYPDEATWDATQNFMLSDPTENAIVEALIEDYLRDGSFREPISIQDDDPDDPEIIHLARGTRGYVINGTHRVCALLRIGAETATVHHPIWAEWDIDEPYTMLESIIEFDSAIEENEIDNIFSVTRSVRISDEQWLTSSIGSGANRKVVISWDVEEGSDVDISLIERELHVRLAKISRKSYTLTTSWNCFDILPHG